MAEIIKPSDMSRVWSSSGDMVKPSNSKIATGWEVEVPPRQWFNWIDNRQDQFNAHVNQHGIPEWDSETEYQANKSITKGSDGNLYRALTTHINSNPVTGQGGNWERLDEAGFTGARQQKDSNGFQELPGGIIFQWVNVSGIMDGDLVTFPIPFPNAVFTVQLTHGLGATNYFTHAVGLTDRFGFRVLHDSATPQGFTALAVGH